MANKNSNPVENFVVVNNGRLDRDASMAAFQAAYNEYAIEKEITHTVVVPALNALFDANRGKRLNQIGIVHEVVAAIQKNVPRLAGTNNVKPLAKKVREVLKAQIASGVLGVKVGANGGIYRIADIVPGG